MRIFEYFRFVSSSSRTRSVPSPTAWISSRLLSRIGVRGYLEVGGYFGVVFDWRTTTDFCAVAALAVFGNCLGLVEGSRYAPRGSI